MTRGSRVGGYDRLNTTPDGVAQEVCLAVLRALPTYQDQGRPFLAFVYGIAQHKVVDGHRSNGRDRRPLFDIPDSPAELDSPRDPARDSSLSLPLQVTSELAGISESPEMSELLARLSPKQREVLRLRVVIGLSAEETAEIVGSTAGAVRVAQHRSLTKLRKMLDAQANAERDSDAAPVTGFADLDGLLHAADANMQRRLPERKRGPSIYASREHTDAAEHVLDESETPRLR